MVNGPVGVRNQNDKLADCTRNKKTKAWSQCEIRCCDGRPGTARITMTYQGTAPTGKAQF